MHIALWGLRGGAGTTSVAAMLADVLSKTGETVLLVDLNPPDMLRLHFGVPYSDALGWADAGQAPFWRQQSHAITNSLTVLPYGYHRTTRMCHAGVATDGDVFWSEYEPVLRKMYSWVLFDVPSRGDQYVNLRRGCDLNMMVTQADMASHILLKQSVGAGDAWILVNDLMPSHRLSNDVLLDWQHQYPARLVPVVVHSDQNIHEAFAHKVPVTTWRPDSSGARDVQRLAQWCQQQRQRIRHDVPLPKKGVA